jgi:hypothetical protein
MKGVGRRHQQSLWTIILLADLQAQRECDLTSNKRLTEYISTMGSCKYNRFQYPGHAKNIVSNIKEICDSVEKFIADKDLSTIETSKCHFQLFDSLRKLKIPGIGPLVFNQFFHSLCLSGILPSRFMTHAAISQGSGPAKLIQMFYPKDKSTSLLEKRMKVILKTINGLGLSSVNEFFIENLMCEVYRLYNKLEKSQRTFQFLCSEKFMDILRSTTMTKNPDIYYFDQCTESYQNLFRIVDGSMYVRFAKNKKKLLASNQCIVDLSYDDNGFLIQLKEEISQDYKEHFKAVAFSYDRD